jgi:hypothetical protein
MNLKNKIIESIEFATKELGWTLISEDWGSPVQKCTCAMGCVMLKDQPQNPYRVGNNASATIYAAEVLGVTEKWVDAFINGYDDNPPPYEEDEDSDNAWNLGKEIAAATKPITHEEFKNGKR